MKAKSAFVTNIWLNKQNTIYILILNPRHKHNTNHYFLSYYVYRSSLFAALERKKRAMIPVIRFQT